MTLRIHFPFAVSDFSITSDKIEHIDAIRALYCCPRQAPEKACRQVTIRQDGACFHVTFEGRSYRTERPLRVVQNILFEQQVYSPAVLPLHAGAVAVGGQAHIFLASTGTGKTTLITYLAARGCAYVNDDRVFLERDSLRCLADVTPVHLRPESLPVLRRHGCEIDGERVEIEDISRIVHMPKLCAAGALPVAGLYFISRCDENSCKSISGGEAVQRLMQNQLRHDASSGALRCAVKLARYCKELKYSDMSYVFDLITKEANPHDA